MKELTEQTVAAQPAEPTETLTEPEIPVQQETAAKPSPASPPEQAAAQPPGETIAPEPQQQEVKQPEPRLPETEPVVEQVVQAQAAETKKAAVPSTPEPPSIKQETTSTVSSPPSSAVQTAEKPAAVKTGSVVQESGGEQDQTRLSETKAEARQEEQTSVTEKSSVPVKTDKSSGPPFISSITFDNSTNRGEMVLFKLNAFHPPTVFGVEEGLPRVVCDFKGAEAARNVPNVIKTNGKYVHTIRIGRDNTPKKVRVVLDLTSNRNYDLQQVFFKDDNLFVIIINSLSNSPSKEELEKPLQGTL